ncbi:hypothetical protein H2201_006695 [Coniosporium apollinis]|uniref:Pre-mRNA-splicing factor 38B n=1 Tax=Coniosporium apollinis TaxID=61459 RepID=A0ABQ9NLF5_9PEZI|nr:hypothetical protein H2201_006695 [Coniosporium apollinis]
MPVEELSDDYVAELLKKDAKGSSSRYAAIGLGALLPQRTGQAPKPNTRFLRNILRETDSHNAALLAKEAEDSRARLKALRRDGAGEPQRGPRDRRNGDGKDCGDSRTAKRRRIDDGASEDEDMDRQRRHRDSGSKRHRFGRDERTGCERSSHRRSRHEEDERSESGSRHRHRRRRRHSSDDESDRARSSRHQRRSRKQEHTSSSDEAYTKRKEESHHKHRRRRSRSRSSSRSRSPDRYRSRQSHHRDRERSRPPRSRSNKKSKELSKRGDRERDRDIGDTVTNGKQRTSKPRSPSTEAAYDSDPLEALIGPLPPPPAPPVRSRGRGTFFNASSAMDARFASTYDPTVDVQPDPELDDDWDQALEALRDRQKWKQQGADRLLAAGFTADEVRKWEKGGEKTEEDVRWAKKGEGREWDRGKVVEEGGEVELRAEWGRLKGT